MRRLVREMTLSHADFLRLLPVAMGKWPYARSGLRFEAALGGRKIMIQLSEQRLIRIGALNLPSVVVTLESAGIADREWNDFLNRFDAAFQRGGG